jgi:hypothetical protein
VAVDTRDKRASIGRAGPVPDGTIDNLDRRHIAGFRRRSLYRYVTSSIVGGPFDIQATGVFTAGGEAMEVFTAGGVAREVFIPGAVAAQVDF